MQLRNLQEYIHSNPRPKPDLCNYIQPIYKYIWIDNVCTQIIINIEKQVSFNGLMLFYK